MLPASLVSEGCLRRLNEARWENVVCSCICSVNLCAAYLGIPIAELLKRQPGLADHRSGKRSHRSCAQEVQGSQEASTQAGFGPWSPVTMFLVNMARPKATRGMWGWAISSLCQAFFFFQIKEETPLNVIDL